MLQPKLMVLAAMFIADIISKSDIAATLPRGQTVLAKTPR